MWIWELNHTEGWVPKNWCFWTVVLEKTLESPLDSKEIKSVNPKGNQPWIIHWKDWCWSWSSKLCPPDGKSQLTGKNPDVGKDWGQEEKGVTEDEMVEWHHQLNGHEFEQTLGDSERQGRLLQFMRLQCLTWLGDWTIMITTEEKGAGRWESPWWWRCRRETWMVVVKGKAHQKVSLFI